MLDLIDRAREQNPRLRLLGIVPSRVGRTRLAAETVQRLRDRYRATLPPIRDFVRIAERPRSHATVYQSPDDHPAKDDFRALAAAIRRRMKETKS
jgi:cellulose biosynthesis protein BcsQ